RIPADGHRGGGRVMPDGRKHLDAVEVAPKVYRVLFENERVRVLGFTTGPGASWPLHGHPDSVVVSLSDYTVRNVVPGHAPSERHSKPGDVRWISATEHTGANVGAT